MKNKHSNLQKYADLEYALERTEKTDIKQTLLLFAYDFKGVKSTPVWVCVTPQAKVLINTRITNDCSESFRSAGIAAKKPALEINGYKQFQ